MEGVRTYARRHTATHTDTVKSEARKKAVSITITIYYTPEPFRLPFASHSLSLSLLPSFAVSCADGGYFFSGAVPDTVLENGHPGATPK